MARRSPYERMRPGQIFLSTFGKGNIPNNLIGSTVDDVKTDDKSPSYSSQIARFDI